MRWAVLACFLLLIGLSGAPAWAGPPDLLEAQELGSSDDAAWLDGREMVFYAEDLENGERYAYGRKKAEERHPPWSSFKIPNFLIALETGAASGLDYRIPYDPVRRPSDSSWPEDWKQEQTLESAFRRSAAWYFQDLALVIGAQAYRGYLGHFAYGNVQVAEGSDHFWLDGTLKVSAREQASFLRRLLIGQLEVSPHNVELLSQVSLLKTEGTVALHGKTGSGPQKPRDFDGAFEGWLVGWVQREGAKPVVFATWAAGPSYQSLRDFRQEASERMLGRIGAWPTSP